MSSMSSADARSRNPQGIASSSSGDASSGGSVGSSNASRGDAFALDTSTDSKERVLARIKHNFYLETQNFRQRIHDATEEAARAKDKVDALQESLIKWKKRCVKMQRKLEEKDAAMQQLQQRQDVQFPLLFDETLRSVQAHMDNQSDDLGSVAPLSHSAISEKAKVQADNDERVHEYERQISALYEELEQEKQRNAMLSECLQEQKAEKQKFMKACKRAKLELQAVRDSGLSQMLADMEAKCAQLEQEKQCLTESLQQKQITIRAQEEEQDEMLEQLEQMREDAVALQGKLDTRDVELGRLRDQIREQQETMENLQADLQDSGHRLNLSEQRLPEDVEEKLGLANHALRVERSRVKILEGDVAQLTNEIAQLRDQLFNRTESSSVTGGSNPGCNCFETLGPLSKQIGDANRKLLALGRVMEVYIDTDKVDLTPLDELRWPSESDSNVFTSSNPAEAFDTVSSDMDKVVQRLDSLQHAMEEIFARAMGSSCAMQ